ncbi:MAG TPA: hypothetical protein DEG17_03410 [Cyanobacteria bacterium UBA11149]|nr:hypothetical protein [Cyanobacteria bacterium UBA11367]HBE61069.1 hypothetical protein [Cyanobacteria bacterium UBA11366]HBK62268.1 hypothetical protein [Cyanobacteria bacterium UBA11166]HBR74254.1 hypothetical protein [Cyanobacteria bacterium UBA11159]HBS69850.1 hypothetical protein [Cyanobacteria bacterium UBA11153]HBW87955.1 hypothetical protein [Cyanobacteria bacterium UBA11149]HCA95013.1 hypothetical protein [Cyanobacteria bacterium UBA9226]
MKIETEFSFIILNKKTGCNETKKFWVSDEVGPNESSLDVVSRLNDFCKSVQGHDPWHLQQEVAMLEDELRKLQSKIRCAKNDWNELALFLKTQGLGNPSMIPELPGFPQLMQATKINPEQDLDEEQDLDLDDIPFGDSPREFLMDDDYPADAEY